MTLPKFKTKFGICTNFWLEKFKENGEVTFATGPFHNKMLNHGLDTFPWWQFDLDPADPGTVRYCGIGTGTSEPAGSQTGLDNEFATTKFNKSSAEINKHDDPSRLEYKAYYQFGIGTFDGENITELGLKSDLLDYEGYINRQLTRVTTEVTDEQIGTGDGSATNFTGSLDNDTCDPETLVITTYDTSDNLMTLEDDGDGGFTGDGSGTILYDTGAFDVTFDSAVKDGQSILADYEWQEPTAITVASDEGLRVYVQILIYTEAEIDEIVSKGPFTFEDLTEETSQDITYDLVPKLFEADFLEFVYSFSGTYIAISAWTSEEPSNRANSMSRSLTNTVDGGPKYDCEATFDPGNFTGDITKLLIFYEGPFDHPSGFGYEVTLDTTITDIQDTEELKFTFTFEWGEV